jgi:hypothetical protein
MLRCLLECQTCKKKYIGETKRDFLIRFKEHLAHITNQRINESAIALHILKNPGHSLDPSSLTLIEKESRLFFRKTKESLYIHNCAHKMNTNPGWKVNPIWASTLAPLLKPV